MKWLLIVLFSLPCIADWQDWNKTDKLLWKTNLVLDVLDASQAYDMIDCQNNNPNCVYVEKNPVFGERPKIENILIGKVVGNIILYQVLDNFPESRRTGLILSNGIKCYVVINNNNIGLNFRFNF